MRRALGRGTVRYAATRFDDASLSRLLPRWSAAAGCRPAVEGAGAGVEVVRRRSGDAAWLFAVNHTGAPAALPAAGHELLGDRPVRGVLHLPAGACAVVREQTPR
ncbi:Beta-galactosidase C-terminal domain [Actinacidiphila sp. DG2A-62]|uniref:Beta-galactosidase C-terminal domain n=1 Tax=Actinacidiphila sp. DG2A-62 TaxID=3108821 RepID=UPI002DB79926|nr:Beta-galactosidase C-terminal domain [Actinacidiphila sp. DG2A-62]MEC3992603.1 Beta-galactosidase C-terminal domain [Actinacidiphila sp. DG2A-62]